MLLLYVQLRGAHGSTKQPAGQKPRAAAPVLLLLLLLPLRMRMSLQQAQRAVGDIVCDAAARGHQLLQQFLLILLLLLLLQQQGSRGPVGSHL